MGFVYFLFTFCDIFCLLFVKDNVNKKLLHKNNSSLKTSTTPFQNSGAPIFLFSKKAFDFNETFMRASRYIREIIPDTKIKFYSFS